MTPPSVPTSPVNSCPSAKGCCVEELAGREHYTSLKLMVPGSPTCKHSQAPLQCMS